MNTAMTKKELATIVGYTYRRLYDIDRDLPQEKKLFVASEGGKYDLAIFVQRWVDFNVERETDDVDDLETVKARHEAVKIEKTELEVAKMRGELISVQDARKLWGDVANTVMRNLVNLPAKVAPQVVMEESAERIAAVFDQEIRRILNDVAETPLPDYAEEDVGVEDEEEEEDE